MLIICSGTFYYVVMLGMSMVLCLKRASTNVLLSSATLIGGAVGSSNVANTASRAFVAYVQPSIYLSRETDYAFSSGYFVGLKAVACSHMMLRLRGYLK